MIIVLNQNDLFKQLQSEKFVIGKSLFKATQILIEKTSLRMLKEISEHQYKKLEYNFKVLKDKWKKLRGGLKRSKFLEGNLKQYLVLNINEVDFEAETFVEAHSETAILPWDNVVTVAISQENAVTAASIKPLFLALGVEFYQEVNGQMYPLKNGAYNPLALVTVSGL